jgi:parvulin-like peptidyl-prolyl isomerase
MKRHEGLLWLIAAGLVVAIGLEGYGLVQKGAGSATPSQSDSTRIRDYAATLKANQLYAKSAEAYDQYLREAGLSDPDKAKVDFNTGTMLLDSVGDAEGALARFLRVTELYKGADPQIVKEARKMSAQCLEKLGRSGAAEHQLIESSRLKVDSPTQEAPVEEKDVLATIGKRVCLSRTEFDEAWKELPQGTRDQQFSGDAGKEKFLQEMVSLRLFAEAARRKGLDREPEVQRRLRTMEESLLFSKLYQSEVSSKVTLPDSDLKLFYEAHREHYQEPASVEVAHILTADATRCLVAKAAIDKGSPFAQVAKDFSTDNRTKDSGGKVGKIQQAKVPLEKPANFDPLDVAVPGLGKQKPFVEAAFGLSDNGQIAGPIKTDRGYHLIQLISKTPASEKSLDEAKQQVEPELRRQREEEKRAELLAELMKTHEVKVFAKKLKG